MKRLMIAGIAGLCAAVSFGLESANVVGYQNKALAGGAAFNLTVNTFKAVGKDADKMTLGDIVPSASWMGGSDEIKTLKANGAVDKAYTYMNEQDAKDWGFTPGWYLTSEYNDDSLDLTDRCKNDELLPLGNGLLVLVGSASTTLTYAGEVLAEDQPITLKGGAAFNITGNISPVDMTLGDILPSASWMGGSDELKTLKSNGAVDQAYTFMNAQDAKDWGFTPGWYLTSEYNNDSLDLTDRCKNSLPVSAGEAFIVLVGSAATTITIPTAL